MAAVDGDTGQATSRNRELLVLLEDQLHARGINLHILTGICAGLHRPDGLRAAQAQGRHGGRPAAVTDDILDIARARRERGESVTAIARGPGGSLPVASSTLVRLRVHADLDPRAAR
jgi:DNA invertase Pin-like site-specific DNA recombinase